MDGCLTGCEDSKSSEQTNNDRTSAVLILIQSRKNGSSMILSHQYFCIFVHSYYRDGSFSYVTYLDLFLAKIRVPQAFLLMLYKASLLLLSSSFSSSRYRGRINKFIMFHFRINEYKSPRWCGGACQSSITL
jgi:hypothetical protein